MRVTPEDIKTFAFCPYLYHMKGADGLYPKPTALFSAMRDSICAAEVEAMRTRGFVTNAMIGKYWNKIWWPTAAKIGLSAKETEDKTLNTALKFNNYCGYDVVGTDYLTLGVGISLEKRLLSGVLVSKIDLLKASFKTDKYVTAVCFGKEKKSRRELSQDIKTMAIIHSLGGFDRDIVLVYVGLMSKRDEVDISSCYYNKDDILQTERTIEFLAGGMKKNINYRPYWTCEGCNKCQSSNS